MQLYERLTILRKQHDITIERLSELSGIPESTLAKIMCGTTAHPSFDNVADILTAMGEPLTSVMDTDIADSISVKSVHGCGVDPKVCEYCPTIIASRSSYTHAFEELKHMHRITQRWLCFLTAYAVLLTFVLVIVMIRA